MKTPFIILTSSLVIGLGCGSAFSFFKKPKKEEAPVVVVDTCDLRPFYTMDISFPEDTPLLKIEGQEYQKKDLPKNLDVLFYQVREEMYQTVENIFYEYGLSYMLSSEEARKNLNQIKPIEELIVASVSKEDVQKYYEDLKSKKSIPENITLEMVQSQIEARLKQQKQSQEAQAAFQKYQKDIQIQALKPIEPLVDIDYQNLPFDGNDKSSLIMGNVSDYFCGHCRNLHPEINKLMEKYKGDYKYIRVPYSLTPRGPSFEVTKGAFCAQEQGKFWEYDKLGFEISYEEAGKNIQGEISKIVEKIKLDEKKFNTCMKAPQTAEKVTQVRKQFSNYGVRGTPTVFINGKRANHSILEKEMLKFMGM